MTHDPHAKFDRLLEAMVPPSDRRNHQPIKHQVRRRPHVVAILKFPQILRKMLRTDMNMRPIDAALEGGPESFQAVDCRARSRDVLPRPMVDGRMNVAAGGEASVALELVRVDRRAGQHMLIDEGLERGAAHVGHNLGNNVSAAFKHPKNDRFSRRSAPALTTFADAADVGFVDLDELAHSADRKVTVNRAHILADHMAHAPRRFVGDAKLALDFLSGDAVPRRAELKHDKKPVAQRRAGAIKRRPGSRVNLKTTVLACI